MGDERQVSPLEFVEDPRILLFQPEPPASYTFEGIRRSSTLVQPRYSVAYFHGLP